MISLLPSLRSWHLLGGAWRPLWADRRLAARPRVGPLPPFFQARQHSGGWNDVMSGGSTLFLACGGSAGSLPPHSAPGLVGGPQSCQVGVGGTQGSQWLLDGLSRPQKGAVGGF